MSKIPDKNTIKSLADVSQLSLKNRENSYLGSDAKVNTRHTNENDKKHTNPPINNNELKSPNSQLQKQMSKSDAQSLDRNNSMQTEKEFPSPTSPLKKLMGALGKGINNIGRGIGKASQGGLKGLGNLGSALKLNQLGKGLNIVSNGLGLNRLGKGIGLMGKQGLKGLNSLSKGLGLDILGKGLNNLSKIGFDQLGKGLKDISKGLNLRKLQENLKKIA